jgi:hypothetical protein
MTAMANVTTFQIGKVDLELEVVGAGVRQGVLPPPDPSDGWPLDERQMTDLRAFEAAGWQLQPQPELNWKDVRHLNSGRDINAGLLAVHPWGGLVVVTDRIVVNVPPGSPPFDPGPEHGIFEPLGPNSYLLHLRLPDAELLSTIRTRLQFLHNLDGGYAGVVAEPMLAYHLGAAAPRDPDDLDTPQWHWEHIGLKAAWRKGLTRGKRADGTPVRVAVIDEGFNTGERQFGPILWSKYIDADGRPTNDPVPSGMHGTFCAGLISARKDGRSVNGAAPDCELILIAVGTKVQVIDGIASNIATQVALAKAIDLCVSGISRRGDDTADVICSSLGPNGQSWELSSELQRAIDNAQKARGGLGIPIVWSDFDSTTAIKSGSLENYDPILCIAQFNQAHDVVDSGFGAGVDLAAPGKGLTLINRTGSGCSYAAPCVAGVAALLVAIKPDLGSKGVANALTTSCDKPLRPVTNGRNDYEGSGRLNALEAVKLVAPPLWRILLLLASRIFRKLLH